MLRRKCRSPAHHGESKDAGLQCPCSRQRGQAARLSAGVGEIPNNSLVRPVWRHCDAGFAELDATRRAGYSNPLLIATHGVLSTSHPRIAALEIGKFKASPQHPLKAFMSSVSSLKKQLGRLIPDAARDFTIPRGPWHGLRFCLSLRHSYHFYLGIYELEIHRWLGRLSQGIHGALDVGTNAGMFAIYFLSKTGARRVVAFEPDPDARERFSHNLRINHLEACPRLELETGFVGSGHGRGRPLDDYLDRLESPIFLKMDIDGGEVEALRGAARLMQSEGFRTIIETHSPELESDCMQLLQEAGLKARVVPRPWWRKIVTEGRPIPHNQWIVAARDPRLIFQ
jgi:hypothetical protein